VGIPFIPSLHPRDLIGQFTRSKGGPKKAKFTNRINPVKRASKVASKVIEREGKAYKAAANTIIKGSVATRRTRRR
jgi:hypothetical protein